MRGKNFYIKTFGCTANKSDSEIMIGILKREGYKLTNLNDADYLIVNTCGVKQPTEERVMFTLKEFSKLNKKLIIAGCLPKINLERIKKEIPDFAAILDPQSIHEIREIIQKIESGKKRIIQFSNASLSKPKLPKYRFNSIIGIIQISEGCNQACAYCCTRFARGRLQCFPFEDIINEAKRLINSGCKEIHLTSQDNASYNFEGKNLASILKEIVKIKRKFFVRVGMMNPSHVKIILNELIEAYRNEKVFKFLHLPVQSGSDHVLKLMNRNYSVKDFKRIVKKFKKEFPSLTLSTDVIVGFPNESEKDFRKSVELIEEIKPDIVNLSKFGKRPRTQAAKMKQLPRGLINERTKKLAKIIDRIKLENNEKWLGWKGEVLIDEKTKKGMMGRNFAYKPITVKGKLGNFKRIKIIEAKPTYLIGK